MEDSFLHLPRESTSHPGQFNFSELVITLELSNSNIHQFFDSVGALPTGQPGPGALILEYDGISPDNALEDDNPFFTLPDNGLTLQPGTYWISCFANMNVSIDDDAAWGWFFLNQTFFDNAHAIRDVGGVFGAGTANVWLLPDLVVDENATIRDHQLSMFGARIDSEPLANEAEMDIAIIIAPVVVGGFCCLCVPLLVLAVFCFVKRKNRNSLPLSNASHNQYDAVSGVLNSVTSGVLSVSTKNFEIPYRELNLKEKIGEGAYGVVYRAVWRKTECAVKQLKIDNFMNNTPALEEFRNEAELMVSFKHPNVIQTLGVVTLPDHPLCIVTGKSFVQCTSCWTTFL